MRDLRMKLCPGCGTLHLPITANLASEELLAERAKRELAQRLEGCTEYTWRFFSTLLSQKVPYVTARELSRDLGISFATLNSRFFRDRLPSPKLYIAGWQLVRLCDALSGYDFTVNRASAEAGFSSGQSAGRFMRLMSERLLGRRIPTVRALRELDSFALWQMMCDKLVMPHVKALRSPVFRPLFNARDGSKVPLRQKVAA